MFCGGQLKNSLLIQCNYNWHNLMSRSSLHLDHHQYVTMTWGWAPRDGRVQRRKDCGLCPWPSPFSLANDESWPPAAPPSTYGHLLFLCIHDGLHLQGSRHHHRRNQTSQFEARLGMGAAEWKQAWSPAQMLTMNVLENILHKWFTHCSNLFMDDHALYYIYIPLGSFVELLS